MAPLSNSAAHLDQGRRTPYGAWVESPGPAAPPSFFLAHSLSPGGLRLRGRQIPDPGAQVDLRLLVENERRVLALQGEVVRHEFDADGPSFAVRFIDLDHEHEQFLADLFEESLFDD